MLQIKIKKHFYFNNYIMFDILYIRLNMYKIITVCGTIKLIISPNVLHQIYFTKYFYGRNDNESRRHVKTCKKI